MYEDQVHGFALRSDWSSEKDKKAMVSNSRLMFSGVAYPSVQAVLLNLPHFFSLSYLRIGS